ncbi:MAG TPA: TadE/TadG family type IV pilus assembly protein [Gemmataceae bacterium]|jgi:Flp pilus assembly protein TadG|nr:TadE/TadG family type IV pilus assembly protein [Gemmataceae bacterium]
MRNRANHERRAVAAVELAVLLPFLVFLFVIAVDFARIFYFSQIIENCARHGAIYASDPKAPAHNLYSSVQQAALADAANANPQPTVTSGTGTDSSGNAYVTVTVTWQFNTITNFPGVPNNVTLSRTVQMRVAPQ